MHDRLALAGVRSRPDHRPPYTQNLLALNVVRRRVRVLDCGVDHRFRRLFGHNKAFLLDDHVSARGSRILPARHALLPSPGNLLRAW